jgi:hypothetical protein
MVKEPKTGLQKKVPCFGFPVTHIRQISTPTNSKAKEDRSNSRIILKDGKYATFFEEILIILAYFRLLVSEAPYAYMSKFLQ